MQVKCQVFGSRNTNHGLSGFYETRDTRHGFNLERGAGCPLGRREFRGFHETRDTKHESRLFSGPKHGFSVAPMVLVGTEALQSCFFGRNVLWVESDDAVARNENLIHARRERAGWRQQSRPSHAFSDIYETRTRDTALAGRKAQAGANSEVFTKHETRNTKHGIFQARNTAFPWLLWCSLVLKPFSLFFPAGAA